MSNGQYRKEKVLLTIKTSSNLGGAERRLVRVFSRIEEFDVTIVVVGIEKYKKTREIILDFVSKENKSKVLFFDSIYKYYQHTRKIKYKWIVFCNESLSFVPRAIISKLSGAKLLWIIANSKTAYLQFSNFMHKFLFKYYSSIADKIDCLYPSTKSGLEKTLSKKVNITPLPYTDFNVFAPSLKENMIVFASRIEPGKGWELFVESLYKTKAVIDSNDYKVIICGSGSQDNKLKRLLSDYKLNKMVKLTGHIRMETILPSTKIFMSLQEIENYPSQSLIEAISSGCACIVTDVGDSWRIAKENFSQLVMPNVLSVSKALQYYIELPNEDLEIISDQARNYALKNFNLKDSIRYYVCLLNEINYEKIN